MYTIQFFLLLYLTSTAKLLHSDFNKLVSWTRLSYSSNNKMDLRRYSRK